MPDRRNPDAGGVPPPATDPLSEFPVTIDVRVHWGDMDAYEHVNNTVYFTWFESARIAYFDRIGFRGDHARAAVGPILASTQCRFRRPLVYPCTVRVGARVPEVGNDRFTMEYRVVVAATGDVAADGSGVVVAFDYRNATKTMLPASVRDAIRALEGGTA